MPPTHDALAPASDRDLRGRTLRGGAITIVAQAIKFVLQMASTMVLARLLLPADFGLLAMVTAITGFLGVLRDAGLSAATVQKAEITSEQVSTLFWVNAALGVLFALLCVLLGPLLVWIYREPKLLGITAALSLTFVITALSVQHYALLRRQMRFKALAVAEIISILAGFIVGLLMALNGFGYWSLVGMSIASALGSLVVVWMAQSWRPGRPRRGCGVLPMLRFGGFVTGTNALNYLFRNADNALIGWYWGAAPLGLYARAYGLLLLPINQVNAPLGNVAVPALSRLHADPERFRHYFLRGYSLVASLVIPIIVALSLFAEDVVLVVLGPNWHEAVTLFRLLAPAALIGALLNPFGWLFVASGRPDRQFRLAMGWAALIVAAFLAGLGYGPAGVATGYSIMSCLLAIPLCRYAIAGTRLRLLDLFNSVRAPLASALIAGGVGLLLQLKLPAVSAARGFANCSLMLLTYSLVLALGFRQWAYYRGLFQELFPGRFAARLA